MLTFDKLKQEGIVIKFLLSARSSVFPPWKKIGKCSEEINSADSLEQQRQILLILQSDPYDYFFAISDRAANEPIASIIDLW